MSESAKYWFRLVGGAALLVFTMAEVKYMATGVQRYSGWIFPIGYFGMFCLVWASRKDKA